ncbi:lytic murein transglycosylase [Pseudorhodoplanes sinuspersici]|uniref:Lytic transglycosylase n=1 Tax=Pseudorhodoplanes sinuspersici TaxID=1235591 RepID=A0A1W6ZMI3_9HYPH|nr:lytic murein transglycosylase [Pseudorhodoplanes sinuspersici]ARP97984.1 lytic transglycosylase [Pseudorhodoplanes sinuspersici]RKE68262.1 lytic murein transglycosylase [Pseudorhodoplanes sinuspersici]
MIIQIVVRLCLVLSVVAAGGLPAHAQSDANFQKFLQSLWPDAQAMGVSRRTFDEATRGLKFNQSLPDLVIPGKPKEAPRGQAEFERTPAQYLSESSLARLTAQGQKLATEHKATLAAIQKRFGVPPPVVLAIWGRETNYGNVKLPYNTIEVLAAQAYMGRRKEMFRRELLLAMKILEEQHVAFKDMKASWAGAMGHTQFLPTDFLKYAVDQDGDGHRDIWTSVPDSLGSAASQLLAKGWDRGKRWGFEVRLPANVDCSIAEPDTKMTVAEWIKRGYAPLTHKPTREELGEEASLFLPAGLKGPAFLTLKNFYVFKGYNFADLYALFVGHLSDRIAGGKNFATPWGKIEQARSDYIETIQRHLTKAGFYSDKIDGKAGMKTRSALGAWQKAAGLPLDCWPSRALAEQMQAAR